MEKCDFEAYANGMGLCTIVNQITPEAVISTTYQTKLLMRVIKC